MIKKKDCTFKKKKKKKIFNMISFFVNAFNSMLLYW